MAIARSLGTRVPTENEVAHDMNICAPSPYQRVTGKQARDALPPGAGGESSAEAPRDPGDDCGRVHAGLSVWEAFALAEQELERRRGWLG